jgi:hypothetical protein
VLVKSGGSEIGKYDRKIRRPIWRTRLTEDMGRVLVTGIILPSGMPYHVGLLLPKYESLFPNSKWELGLITGERVNQVGYCTRRWMGRLYGRLCGECWNWKERK